MAGVVGPRPAHEVADRALAGPARVPADRGRPLEPQPRAQPGGGLRHPLRRRPALPGAALLGPEPDRPRRHRRLRLPSSRRRPGCPASRSPSCWGGRWATSSTASASATSVDFVHVYWRQYQWPDFNVADSAITMGVTLLILDILRSPPSRTRAPGGHDGDGLFRREDRLTCTRSLFTIPGFPPSESQWLPNWLHGPFTLHTYGLLLAVAFLAGLWVASRQAKRAGLDANRVTDMAVWVLIAGLVGRQAHAPRRGLEAVLDGHRLRAPVPLPERRGLLRRPARGNAHGLVVRAPLRAARLAHRRRARPRGRDRPGHRPPGLLRRRAAATASPRACPGRSPSPTPTPCATPAPPSTPHCTPASSTSRSPASSSSPSSSGSLPGSASRARWSWPTRSSIRCARFGLEFFRGDPERGVILGLSTSQAVAVVLVLAAAFLFPRLRRQKPCPSPAPA